MVHGQAVRDMPPTCAETAPVSTTGERVGELCE